MAPAYGRKLDQNFAAKHFLGTIFPMRFRCSLLQDDGGGGPQSEVKDELERLPLRQMENIRALILRGMVFNLPRNIELNRKDLLEIILLSVHKRGAEGVLDFFKNLSDEDCNFVLEKIFSFNCLKVQNYIGYEEKNKLFEEKKKYWRALLVGISTRDQLTKIKGVDEMVSKIATDYYSDKNVYDDLLPYCSTETGKLALEKIKRDIFVQKSKAIPYTSYSGNIESSNWCFLSGTLIATPSGSVPIENLKNGEKILAFDGSALVESYVLEIKASMCKSFIKIAAISSKTNVTHEHPFKVADGRFVEAALLSVGDKMLILSEKKIVPEELTANICVKQQSVIYKLRTAAPNTFFADGFAVHNKGG
jgi:hypothetical protein